MNECPVNRVSELESLKADSKATIDVLMSKCNKLESENVKLKKNFDELMEIFSRTSSTYKEKIKELKEENERLRNTTSRKKIREEIREELKKEQAISDSYSDAVFSGGF